MEYSVLLVRTGRSVGDSTEGQEKVLIKYCWKKKNGKEKENSSNAGERYI